MQRRTFLRLCGLASSSAIIPVSIELTAGSRDDRLEDQVEQIAQQIIEQNAIPELPVPPHAPVKAAKALEIRFRDDPALGNAVCRNWALENGFFVNKDKIPFTAGMSWKPSLATMLLIDMNAPWVRTEVQLLPDAYQKDSDEFLGEERRWDDDQFPSVLFDGTTIMPDKIRIPFTDMPSKDKALTGMPSFHRTKGNRLLG